MTSITSIMCNTEQSVGNRVQKVDSVAITSSTYNASDDLTGFTNFLWDQQNLVEERDSALALLAHYTDFPGYWGGLASMRRGGASSFYGFDLQGTTRALLDALANITDQYWLTAFGEEIASSGTTENPYRYIGIYGYYRDEIDNMQVRARQLRSDWARWLSRDPRRGRFSVAGYWYVGNDPSTIVDPSGARVAPQDVINAFKKLKGAYDTTRTWIDWIQAIMGGKDAAVQEGITEMISMAGQMAAETPSAGLTSFVNAYLKILIWANDQLSQAMQTRLACETCDAVSSHRPHHCGLYNGDEAIWWYYAPFYCYYDKIKSYMYATTLDNRHVKCLVSVPVVGEGPNE